MTSISEKAMLVTLNISRWTARKHDRAVSEEVAQAKSSNPEMGRFNKRLVAKEALEAITQAASEARTFHYEQTLPWIDQGARILPAANYLVYAEKMRSLKAKFDDAVRDFLTHYSNYVLDASRNLGDLFKPGDYPAEHEIAGKFEFSTAVTPMPSAADFRVTLADGELERVRQEIEARTREAVDRATRDLWERVHEVVERMATRLRDHGTQDDNGARRYFKNAAVDGVVSMVDLMRRLNVTDDPRLEEIRQRMEAELAQHTAEAIREDEALRKQVAASADDILAAMAGYVGAAPGALAFKAAA